MWLLLSYSPASVTCNALMGIFLSETRQPQVHWRMYYPRLSLSTLIVKSPITSGTRYLGTTYRVRLLALCAFSVTHFGA